MWTDSYYILRQHCVLVISTRVQHSVDNIRKLNNIRLSEYQTAKGYQNLPHESPEIISETVTGES